MPVHPVLTPGHSAVITGAASGIGLTAAKRFAALGLNVMLADLAGPRLEAAAAEVATLGKGRVVAQPTDVSRLADIEALERRARPFPRVLWRVGLLTGTHNHGQSSRTASRP